MSSSLTRAFTKRHQKPVVVSAPMPYREGQPKFAAGTIKRKEISLPVQLVSSTNLLAYNAPDLPKSKSNSNNSSKPPQSDQLPELKKSTVSPANSSSSSFRSGSDSDVANSSSPSSSSSSIPSPSHGSGTPITSPELSAEEVSPILPEPNHLSGYFDSPKRSKTHHYNRSSTSSSLSQTPKLPHRSLSHTKRSHQELARQRSLSRGSVSPPPPTTTSLTHSQSNSNSHSINRTLSTHSTRSSRLSQERLRQVPESSAFTSTSISTPPHPFGKELEQVNEVAEEFATVQHAVIVEEEQMLVQRGLYKFEVEEYIMEIEGLYRAFFDDVVGYSSSSSSSKGYGGGKGLVSGNAWI
ncbi:hypothetical protein EMCG_03312 [[Emmonsia] crescens]|uniref:Uncharacterized protein n=1 Tax=[Emmonsia] crescens TaxID=73230 RepID=A0A0G2J0B0_9EURO|nr:hypothetical protein EMCG_03312 [Emmonsia crescens UAMH 3008]